MFGLFDVIMDRIDLIIFAIVVIVIYVALLYLWRKTCSMESSLNRLDKVITGLSVKSFSTKFANSDLQKSKAATANGGGGMGASVNSMGELEEVFVCQNTNATTKSKGKSKGTESMSMGVFSVSKSQPPEVIIEDVTDIQKDLSEMKQAIDGENGMDDSKSETSKHSGLGGGMNVPMTKTKLSKMNLDAVREYCNQLSISTEGTKNEMIARILEFETSNEL
jgi:hypothetical protein